MTPKQLVFDLLQELPDDSTLADILDQIAMLAAIQRGMSAVANNRVVPHDEVKRRIATWLAQRP